MAVDSVILKMNAVTAVFDGFYALTEVDVAVQRGTVHFFIGPNGAGKTTLLDIICARTKPTSGTVQFFAMDGKRTRLTGMREHRIVRLGIVRKFQVPSVFGGLSVWDNMVLSLSGKKGIRETVFFRLSAEERDFSLSLLDRVGLADRRDEPAGALSHGEKQWLEIAMQFAARPELILLDEPVAGMGQAETERTAEILREARASCTVVVVEHDMEFVKEIADAVTVLHEGRVLKEGTAKEVLQDETVRAVYLGRGEAEA